MTGSMLALIITPIVTVIVLAAWLIMVFYADAHPAWRHKAASERDSGEGGDRVAERDPGQKRAA